MKSIKDSDLTAAELRSALRYDAETGKFTWLIGRGGNHGRRIKPGTPAGCDHVRKSNRRRSVVIAYRGRLYQAHRLAWLYSYGEWPQGVIDHINGNSADNRLVNLRIATQRQNIANQRTKSSNTSGYKGVSYDKSRRKFSAKIRMPDGRRAHLGRFDTPEEAAAAYQSALIDQYGEFARLS